MSKLGVMDKGVSRDLVSDHPTTQAILQQLREE
jgi:hypothetical protein